jgi:phosphohistidine phosphatase
MDLILWRHAQAQEIAASTEAVDARVADMARPLTALGVQQAEVMALWLNRHLKSNTRILASPALRCEQTVGALGLPYEVKSDLSPDKTADDLLGLAQWPDSERAVLVVGHQPVLSQVVMRLLECTAQEWALRKGAVWWLRSRQRHGRLQTVLATVQSPGFI